MAVTIALGFDRSVLIIQVPVVQGAGECAAATFATYDMSAAFAQGAMQVAHSLLAARQYDAARWGVAKHKAQMTLVVVGLRFTDSRQASGQLTPVHRQR